MLIDNPNMKYRFCFCCCSKQKEDFITKYFLFKIVFSCLSFNVLLIVLSVLAYKKWIKTYNYNDRLLRFLIVFYWVISYIWLISSMLCFATIISISIVYREYNKLIIYIIIYIPIFILIMWGMILDFYFKSATVLENNENYHINNNQQLNINQQIGYNINYQQIDNNQQNYNDQINYNQGFNNDEINNLIK